MDRVKRLTEFNKMKKIFFHKYHNNYHGDDGNLCEPTETTRENNKNSHFLRPRHKSLQMKYIFDN